MHTEARGEERGWGTMVSLRLCRTLLVVVMEVMVEDWLAPASLVRWSPFLTAVIMLLL